MRLNSGEEVSTTTQVSLPGEGWEPQLGMGETSSPS